MGAIIGSFLNVVVIRYGTGMKITGRSKCMSCLRTLTVLDLIPLVSYVGLRGRCRGCKSKISSQYFSVELATSVLFLLGYLSADLDLGWVSVWNIFIFWVVSAIMVAISVYDFKHKIIPDGLSYSLAGIALFKIIFDIWINGESFFSNDSVMSYLAGPFFFLIPFAALWYFSGGRAMGFGDAKLALGVGWFLGFGQTTVALMLAFWIGAVCGVGMIALQKIFHKFGLKILGKQLKMNSEVPFGPFIILGFLIVYLCGISFDNFMGFMAAILPNINA